MLLTGRSGRGGGGEVSEQSADDDWFPLPSVIQDRMGRVEDLMTRFRAAAFAYRQAYNARQRKGTPIPDNPASILEAKRSVVKLRVELLCLKQLLRASRKFHSMEAT
jgi:hypothetical protein